MRQVRDQKEPDQIDAEPRFSDAFNGVTSELYLMDEEEIRFHNLHHYCIEEQGMRKEEKRTMLELIDAMFKHLRTIRKAVKEEATDE